MSRYLMLRTPSANRVYAGEAGPLTAAELELTARFARDVEEADVAGVGYLSFEADELADGAERDGVEELVGGDLVVGRLAERELLGDRDRRSHGVVELLGLLRIGSERGGDPGVELLPDPRHAEHDVGMHR